MVSLLFALALEVSIAGGCLAAEAVCDGLDEDCDGAIDDDGVCGCAVAVRDDRPYLLCTNLLSWTDARDYCATRGPYRLATLSDAAEDAWLDGAIDAVSTSAWWVGLNDRGAEGSFGWADGSDVVYTNWEGDEPNDSGSNEDCAELNRFGDGTWNDANCATTRRFVCEASATPYAQYPDDDGDGWGDGDGDPIVSTDPIVGLATDLDDCNDHDAASHPGQAEVCYDGVDADCDGRNDYDCDEDGFVSDEHPGMAGGSSPGEGDCDDADPDVVPGPDCDPDTGDTGAPDTGHTDTGADTDTADTDSDDPDTAGDSDTSGSTSDSDSDTEALDPVGYFTGGGCSCDGSASPLSGALGLALAALALRRRTR